MHVLRFTWCSSDIVTISDYCILCFSHKPWGFLRTASFWHGKREVCFVNVGCCKRSSNLNFTSSACCLLITSFRFSPANEVSEIDVSSRKPGRSTKKPRKSAQLVDPSVRYWNLRRSLVGTPPVTLRIWLWRIDGKWLGICWKPIESNVMECVQRAAEVLSKWCLEQIGRKVFGVFAESFSHSQSALGGERTCGFTMCFWKNAWERDSHGTPWLSPMKHQNPLWFV